MSLKPLPGVLLVCAAVQAAGDPKAVPEYLYKSILMKKVADFVEWPAAEAGAPFTIGVLGKSPFGDQLASAYAGRTIKGRKVRILFLAEPDEAPRIDLLFICASEKWRIRSVLARLKDPGVLTFGDTEGFAQAGVMVNVRMREGTAFFELNLGSLHRARFAVNPAFVRIAREVVE